MKYFVYSTLSNSHYYTNWTRPSDPTMKPEPITDKSKRFPVFIEGGANIATSPESERGRHTPKGVVTEITEEQLDYCRQNKVFIKHEKQGLLIVISSNESPEKVAKDMTPRDSSAPLNPNSPEFKVKDPESPEETVKPLGSLDKAVDTLKTGPFGRMFR